MRLQPLFSFALPFLWSKQGKPHSKLESDRCIHVFEKYVFFSLDLSNLVLEVFVGSISLTSAILENLDMYFAVFTQQTTLAL